MINLNTPQFLNEISELVKLLGYIYNLYTPRDFLSHRADGIIDRTSFTEDDKLECNYYKRNKEYLDGKLRDLIRYNILIKIQDNFLKYLDIENEKIILNFKRADLVVYALDIYKKISKAMMMDNDFNSFMIDYFNEHKYMSSVKKIMALILNKDKLVRIRKDLERENKYSHIKLKYKNFYFYKENTLDFVEFNLNIKNHKIDINDFNYQLYEDLGVKDYYYPNHGYDLNFKYYRMIYNINDINKNYNTDFLINSYIFYKRHLNDVLLRYYARYNCKNEIEILSDPSDNFIKLMYFNKYKYPNYSNHLIDFKKEENYLYRIKELFNYLKSNDYILIGTDKTLDILDNVGVKKALEYNMEIKKVRERNLG